MLSTNEEIVAWIAQETTKRSLYFRPTPTARPVIIPKDSKPDKILTILKRVPAAPH